MNLKKYMSKNLIMRLFLLLLLVGSAAVFDMVHAANRKLAGEIHNIPSPDETETNKTFFCNQVPVFNLKTAGTEASLRIRFACSQDKFLVKHYNLRTFQLMKAESLHSFSPDVCLSHSLPFLRVLYASPDDMPPLS